MDPTKPKRKRRRRDYIAPSLALVAIAIVVVTGWRRSHRAPPTSSLPEQGMHEQLTEAIPNGTPLGQAQSTLQGRGFHCELIPPTGYMPVQPLFCTRDDAAPGSEPLRWQVIVLQDPKGGVAHITVVRNVLKPQ